MSVSSRRDDDITDRTRSGMSLEEVAAELGLSRARVWQIERSALRKLRRNPAASALLSYVSFEPNAEAMPASKIERVEIAKKG